MIAPSLRRSLALVAAVCLVPACDGVGGSAVEGGSGPALVDVDALPTLRLEERFTLGGPDAPEAESFTREPMTAVGPDGRLYALDPGPATVSRFDGDGAYLGSIGRRGEGPGEFTFPASLGFTGDSLWVRNLSPPFVEFFDTSGAYLGRHTVEDPIIARGGIPAGPTAMLRGGARYEVEGAPLAQSAAGRVDVPVKLTRTDGVVDTLAFVSDPPEFYLPGVGTLGVVPKEVWSPLHASAADGSAVWVAEWADSLPGAVTLRRVVIDGVETRHTLALPPVPLPASSRDSLIAAASDTVRAVAARIETELGRPMFTVPDDLEGAVADALALGTHLPPIRRMVPGADGSLWLERATAPNQSEWIVLDASGELVGRVDLPEGHRLRAASLDAVWTTHRDEFDVAYVTRFDAR
ncbi:MAG: hypothetical protein ACF8NJ_07805 [Phycisphaerales bacterium JB038]